MSTIIEHGKKVDVVKMDAFTKWVLTIVGSIVVAGIVSGMAFSFQQQAKTEVIIIELRHIKETMKSKDDALHELVSKQMEHLVEHERRLDVLEDFKIIHEMQFPKPLVPPQ